MVLSGPKEIPLFQILGPVPIYQRSYFFLTARRDQCICDADYIPKDMLVVVVKTRVAFIGSLPTLLLTPMLTLHAHTLCLHLPLYLSPLMAWSSVLAVLSLLFIPLLWTLPDVPDCCLSLTYNKHLPNYGVVISGVSLLYPHL